MRVLCYKKKKKKRCCGRETVILLDGLLKQIYDNSFDWCSLDFHLSDFAIYIGKFYNFLFLELHSKVQFKQNKDDLAIHLLLFLSFINKKHF